MNGRPVWAATSRENPATTASTAAPRTMGYHWCTRVVNEDEDEDMASKSPYQSPNRAPIWNCRGKPPPVSAVGTEASRRPDGLASDSHQTGLPGPRDVPAARFTQIICVYWKP